MTQRRQIAVGSGWGPFSENRKRPRRAFRARRRRLPSPLLRRCGLRRRMEPCAPRSRESAWEGSDACQVTVQAERSAPFLRLAYSAPAPGELIGAEILRFTLPATKALPFVKLRADDQPLWRPESFWMRRADRKTGRRSSPGPQIRPPGDRRHEGRSRERPDRAGDPGHHQGLGRAQPEKRPRHRAARRRWAFLRRSASSSRPRRSLRPSLLS